MQITVHSTNRSLSYDETLTLEGLIRLHFSTASPLVMSAEAVMNESVADSQATRFRCHLLVRLREREPILVEAAAATTAAALRRAVHAVLHETRGRARPTNDVARLAA